MPMEDENRNGDIIHSIRQRGGIARRIQDSRVYSAAAEDVVQRCSAAEGVTKERHMIGANIRERDGWTVVVTVAVLFYLAVFLVLRAWRHRVLGRASSRSAGRAA